MTYDNLLLEAVLYFNRSVALVVVKEEQSFFSVTLFTSDSSCPQCTCLLLCTFHIYRNRILRISTNEFPLICRKCLGKGRSDIDSLPLLHCRHDLLRDHLAISSIDDCETLCSTHLESIACLSLQY